MRKLISLLLLLSALAIQAQVPGTPAGTPMGLPPEAVAKAGDQIRTDILRRGLDPAVVEARMHARGYDLATLTPEQLPAAQAAFQQVIAELEAERRSTAAPTDTNPAFQPPARPDTFPPIPSPAQPSALHPLPSLPSTTFGQEIFRNKRLQLYQQTSETTIPEDYMLGPGDKLVVSVWGQVSNYTEQLTVNGEGYVQPSSLPRVYLSGLTFAQARAQLQAVFARRYPVGRNNFAVSLSVARTVDVTITGEVFNYGTFRLSALNTAFNALIAAGGPTDIGSVRNITLYRGGRPPQRLDVYQFLLDPSLSRNFYLQSGDNLFVPVAGRVIEVAGAVKRPARYELIAGENLKKLLEWAGGLGAEAFTENVQVARTVNQQRVLLDVNLRDLLAGSGDFTLLDGDVVTVRAVETPLTEYVAVEGAVEYGGQYAFTPGLRLSELAARVRLRREARTDFAYLLRLRPDSTTQYLTVNLAEAIANPAGAANIALQARDRLVVFAQSLFTDAATLQSEGALRQPGVFPFDAGRSLRVRDLVELSGGLRPEATDFAYLIRTYKDNPKEKNYLRIDLRLAVGNPASAQNLVLEPNDRLLIPSKATYKDVFMVQVRGAVRNPGDYQWDETLRMQDVLSLAGGLRLEAASNRVDVFRVILNQNQPTTVTVGTFTVDSALNVLGAASFALQPFDIVVVRTVPEFELQKMVTILGEVRYPGDYALIDKNEHLLSLLQRAGGLAPEAFPEGATLHRKDANTGYVVLRLAEVLRNPANRHNFLLKAGDVVTIPKTKDLVTIRGATKAFDLYPDKVIGNGGSINVAWNTGKRARWYIHEYAVGFSKNADRKAVTVEYANGELKRTKNFGLFKIYPKVPKGATINVGHKPPEPPPPPPGPERKKVDWDQVLARVTAVVTLAVLLSRL